MFTKWNALLEQDFFFGNADGSCDRYLPLVRLPIVTFSRARRPLFDASCYERLQETGDLILLESIVWSSVTINDLPLFPCSVYFSNESGLYHWKKDGRPVGPTPDWGAIHPRDTLELAE